jgi:tetratricopeptide (TPR) repeat protein
MVTKHQISAEVHYLQSYANELLNQGEFQMAIEYFDQVIEKVPDFANFYNGKGVALEGLDKTSDALTCYEKAIETDPYHSEAWFNRGMALRKAGRDAESSKSEKIASCLEQGREIQKFMATSPTVAIPFH